ncbi:class I SAM-dependent DNA methyltransferase [Jeotgalibacillus soli]|uniref:SAM-dependent methyltransferase n=1 Tax=Jeotgalibacillus soli TaxID=889306 RepID=A0A0C2VKG9_9BACL|nr:class I SAM-dependent methyltransferase [Jeotgalibacillus soli]KIL44473.1 SAM-dependent methyltransferase [Jeotgalibacillus soli]
MSYGRFAEVYDQLMSDMPYNQWINFVLDQVSLFNVSGKRLLDIGCGTGECTIKIAQEGFEVTGIDLSDAMLSVAADKAARQGVPIQLFQQDMAELEGFEPFDVITIFCDSLNYLEEVDQVRSTFSRVYEQLLPGGLLLFDVHSLYKIHEMFIDQTFTFDNGDVAYIWNSFPGEEADSVEHELSFFVLENEKKDLYARFDELHKQRTFSVEQYTKWLQDAGFTVETVTADFLSSQSPTETSERIFFTCRKL